MNHWEEGCVWLEPVFRSDSMHRGVVGRKGSRKHLCLLSAAERRCCRKIKEMDRVYTKRGGPEWKQGRTGQTLASISTPPLPLVAVFAIAVLLLSLSQYSLTTKSMYKIVCKCQVVALLGACFLDIFHANDGKRLLSVEDLLCQIRTLDVK